MPTIKEINDKINKLIEKLVDLIEPHRRWRIQHEIDEIATDLQNVVMEQDDGCYYAYFEHPDGKWYMLWITHTKPKTQRGHAWHVHRTYDPWGTSFPNLDAKWWTRPCGQSNDDFNDHFQAVAKFKEIYKERIDKGYICKSGLMPPK